MKERNCVCMDRCLTASMFGSFDLKPVFLGRRPELSGPELWG